MDLGILDIIEVIKETLPKNLPVSEDYFIKRNSINIIIEDFHNKYFLKYIESIYLDSSVITILVLTEFVGPQYAGKLLLNRFGLKRRKLIIFGEYNLFNLPDIFYIFFPNKIRNYVYGRKYWIQREKGLKNFLKNSPPLIILTLHPEIKSQMDLYLNELKIKDIEVYCLYPIVKVSQHRLNTEQWMPIYGTFGFLNRYRNKEIKKIEKNWPLKIFKLNHIENSRYNSKIKKNSYADTGLVDLYIKNTQKWPYCSPIRIFRSLKRGIPVATLATYQDSHPILKTLVKGESLSEIDKVFRAKGFMNTYNAQLNVYNLIAQDYNNLWLEKILDLSSI